MAWPRPHRVALVTRTLRPDLQPWWSQPDDAGETTRRAKPDAVAWRRSARITLPTEAAKLCGFARFQRYGRLRPCLPPRLRSALARGLNLLCEAYIPLFIASFPARLRYDLRSYCTRKQYYDSRIRYRYRTQRSYCAMERITITLTPELKRLLDSAASGRGLSRSEAAQAAITQWVRQSQEEDLDRVYGFRAEIKSQADRLARLEGKNREVIQMAVELLLSQQPNADRESVRRGAQAVIQAERDRGRNRNEQG